MVLCVGQKVHFMWQSRLGLKNWKINLKVCFKKLENIVLWQILVKQPFLSRLKRELANANLLYRPLLPVPKL